MYVSRHFGQPVANLLSPLNTKLFLLSAQNRCNLPGKESLFIAPVRVPPAGRAKLEPWRGWDIAGGGLRVGLRGDRIEERQILEAESRIALDAGVALGIRREAAHYEDQSSGAKRRDIVRRGLEERAERGGPVAANAVDPLVRIEVEGQHSWDKLGSLAVRLRPSRCLTTNRVPCVVRCEKGAVFGREELVEPRWIQRCINGLVPTSVTVDAKLLELVLRWHV